MIGRREFISLLGGAAAAWPVAANAEQITPLIGYLDSIGPPNPSLLAAFHNGLRSEGFVVGRNLAIEYRTADHYDQLAEHAVELARRPVTVMFAFGTTNSARAAKAATTRIPIVFVIGSDPVRLGLVASLNRPEGNVTGVTFMVGELIPKRLELLREFVPQAGTIGFLTNPDNLISEGNAADLKAAASLVRQRMLVFHARNEEQIEEAFGRMRDQDVRALLVDVDGLFNRRRDRLILFAAKERLPTIYATRLFAEAGGLISYGDNREESIRLGGVYVGRLLKGERPADLPVIQPTKFELVINLKTAKDLGLSVPPMLLARADEVIE